jgi:hypothetical protein
MTASITSVIGDVVEEALRVDGKRGQDVETPDGTGGARWASMAYLARADYDFAERDGEATFALALREELYEALAETEPEKLRAELVQVASVAIRWIRAIDSRADRG